MLAAEQSRERSRTINRLISDCELADISRQLAELTMQAQNELLHCQPDNLKKNGHPDRGDLSGRSAAKQGLKNSVIASDVSGTNSTGSNLNARSATRRVEGRTPGIIPELRVIQTIDLRYKGQSHTLNLQWTDLEAIEQTFHQKHEDTYGHQMKIDVELVNLRVRVIATHEPFELPAWKATQELNQRTFRMSGIDEEVIVVNRAGLEVGQKIGAPACECIDSDSPNRSPTLITETSSTTWLAEKWSLAVDEMGNLLLTT